MELKGRNAVAKLNDEAVEGKFPVLNGMVPLCRDVLNGKEKEFKDSVITGENSACFGDFPKGSVDRFHGVSGVKDTANIGWIIEERDEVGPVCLPRF